jgi:hypothetical protein
VGRTQSARATKYIEFHGSVRLPHVYLPAHSLHTTERALQAAGCRKQVRLTGRKLRQLVQIQIGVESLRVSSHCWNSQLFEARAAIFFQGVRRSAGSRNLYPRAEVHPTGRAVSKERLGVGRTAGCLCPLCPPRSATGPNGEWGSSTRCHKLWRIPLGHLGVDS